MYKKTTLVAAGVAAFAFSALASAADVHTRTIAATCMSCHGPHGKSVGATPGLAGMEKAYFVTAMQEFKSGKRPGTIMKKHAAGYTEAEYAAMGEFFASLK